MTVIRNAEAGDLDAVRACAIAAYALYVPRIGRKPAPMVADFEAHQARHELHVAVDERGSVRGYIVCYPRADQFHVENVAVDPAHQGQGVGRALLHFADGAACQAGLGMLELYTNAKMTENLALYTRLGFQETGRRIEDGFDRVYFRKVLASKP